MRAWEDTTVILVRTLLSTKLERGALPNTNEFAAAIILLLAISKINSERLSI